MRQTASGLFVASERPPAPEAQPDAPETNTRGWPVLKDWSYSKCGERHHASGEVAFRRRALEDLYTAADPGGGGIFISKHDEKTRARCVELLDELAVLLVGGVPHGCEAYT